MSDSSVSKKIRIGCGSGGCTWERLEPTIELLEKGRLDYLVFECLAERTIAAAQKEKLKNPAKGYNPMLEERMRKVLPLAMANSVKIVSNMGGANPAAAVDAIIEIAREQGVSGLRIARVEGDDLLERVKDYYDRPLWDSGLPLRSLDGCIISANVYLSSDPIRDALDQGADIVITGRVADPALFVGPLKHEFGWDDSRQDKLGQALLLGHLMECAAQLTGGYYADPGYKDVPDLHRLGQPIAEIDGSGDFLITKVEGSGGLVCVDVCREQLLYEIGDPSHYITPDGIADFSRVTFEQKGKDLVLARGGMSRGLPDTWKVNIGYQDCWVGEAEISFGGTNAMPRARLAADIVKKRMEITGTVPDEFRTDFIGYSSLYGEELSGRFTPQPRGEIRLRIAARAKTKETVTAVVREVQCMYINGPAGSSGITSDVDQMLSVENILIPKQDVHPHLVWYEV